jgi:curved DNA-binding protein CbpA
MPASARDPYDTLGVAPSASDQELRAAYRHLVQLHHPDHNGGSAESARRFEEVQDAYAEVRRLRQAGGGRAGASGAAGGRAGASGGARARAGASGAQAGADPGLDSRLADMERELREANAARERARRAAREAAAAAASARAAERPADARRATDEELGYVSTDDSFSKIIADARDELFGRVTEARESPAAKRVGDLLDELAAKLKGEGPEK